MLKQGEFLVIWIIITNFAPKKSNNIMILQEKINKKAEGYGKFALAFLEGVEFALNNQWISVQKDLPCNHKELISPDKSSENFTVTEYVVVVVYGYKLLSRMYKLDGKWYWETDEPTHWFPIPELPKE